MSADAPTPEAAAVAARRKRLSVDANPGAALDYLNLLEGRANGAGAHITLRYVPDRNTVSPTAFADYLSAFADTAAESLEALAVAVLADINNEVVPRWVQVVAAREDGAAGRHRVLIEDRQPNWDNPALLARLERF